MREYKVNGSIGAEEGGLGHEVLKKNRNFYIGVAGSVLEGMLSGSLFMLLYAVMQFLWAGRFDMNQALVLTGVFAALALRGVVSGQDFLTIFLIVVSFYFGTQSQKLQDTLDSGDDGR